MVKIALSAAAILASAAALVSAAPVEERATTKPRVFATGGRIEIVGPNGFNQSATFDKPGGKLSLGTMSAGLQIDVLTHSDDYSYATGYVYVGPLSCVTANKASGPTSFLLDSCPGQLYPDDKRDPKELELRQRFQFNLEGEQLHMVLGDASNGIATRPNVRVVGGGEIHTTQDRADKLYLNTYSGYRN